VLAQLSCDNYENSPGQYEETEMKSQSRYRAYFMKLAFLLCGLLFAGPSIHDLVSKYHYTEKRPTHPCLLARSVGFEVI
jgi:hypothetical protein